MRFFFSEKRRVPAWCDRILYWTRDKSVRVQQILYKSIEHIVFSDHKPVCSIFDLTVKLIDEEKRNIIYEDLLREADKRANELLPQISLSQTDVKLFIKNFLYFYKCNIFSLILEM